MAVLGLAVFSVGAAWPSLALPDVAQQLLYVGLYVAAAGLVAWRALGGHNGEREGFAWLLVAGGMLAWAGGYAYFFAVLSRSAQSPVPSPADVLWLSYYLFSLAGLLVLLRPRLLRRSGDLFWLNASNALAVLLTGSALITAAVYEPLLERADATAATVVTALLYPLLSVTVLVLLFTVFAVNSWRPGRLWGVVGGAWLLHAIGDLFYADQASTGSYVGGGLLDATWPLAMLAIAYAAWRWPDSKKKLQAPVASVATPVLVGLIAVGVLVYGNLAHVPQLTTVLAVLAILAAASALGLVEYRTHQLRSQARRDPLTGLLNHREYHETIVRLIDHGAPFAIALLDLDAFKQVNDLYGHAEGDRVLRSVADALEESCRDEDVICRIGGDEFAIVLSAACLADAEHVVARLAVMIERIEPAVGASAGLARWPDDGPGKDALLLQADMALYAAKNGHDGLERTPGERAGEVKPITSAPTDRLVSAPIASGHGTALARLDRLPSWAVVAACGALTALIFAAKLTIPDPRHAVLTLCAAPIALLALRFGRLGGALGALAGILLIGFGDYLNPSTPGFVGYLTRAFTFLTVGLLVGHYSDLFRRARASLERRVVLGSTEVLVETAKRSTAERELAAERDFLAAVLESLDEGIVACDAQGSLSFFNEATRRLHNLPARQIPATEWAEHYSIFSADGTTAMPSQEIPLNRAFAGEVIRDVPMVVVTAGRGARTLLASGRPIVDADSRQHGAVVAMRDVTDQLRSQRELESATAETIERLGRAVALRDGPTGGHVERMSHICRMLAERAGLAPGRCEVIQIASVLHDIGKIAVPDAVLRKSGQLDPDEWKLMEMHTVCGHELLDGSSNPVLQLAATIALSHHERIDGTGYPHGLEGERIPFEARIAAVADAFDALTSDRPYRAAFSTSEALQIMYRERGTHFDAELYDLLAAFPPDPSHAHTPVDRVDPHDDENAERERQRSAAGLAARSVEDDRHAARERRAASDSRIRAAAERAATLRTSGKSRPSS